MQKLSRKLVYNAVPSTGLDIFRAIWMFAAVAVFLAVGSLWGTWLNQIQMTSHRQYTGQISPDSDPITISLPSGAVLEKTLTARNDAVKTGQTLATFDIAAMKRSINTIEQELLRDDVLRDCLISQKKPDEMHIGDVPKSIHQALEFAFQKCNNLLDKLENIDDKLALDQEHLVQELQLVKRYMKVLAVSTSLEISNREKQSDARQALALALLQNRLKQQADDLELQANQARAKWNDERLSVVRDLDEQIQLNSELRHSILAHLETPRLQAPLEGRVVRVRKFAGNSAQTIDTNFIEVRPTGGQGYQVHFTLPKDNVGGVKAGDPIRATMLGMLDNSPILTGTVSDIQSFGREDVLANVSLDEESTSQLDNPAIGIALRGRGTASTITVSKENYNVLALLRGQLLSGLQLDHGGWLVEQIRRQLLQLRPHANDLG